MKILYVEDNALVREVTRELLECEGREIVSVCDAEEALRAFAEDRFEVVITDVSLPTMSGLDLARLMLDSHPNLAVILATGYVLENDVARLGPRVRTLTKPFGGADIEALLKDLIAP